MSLSDDLNAKLTALETSAQTANDRADKLIAGNAAIAAQVATLQAQVATLQSAGAITPDDLTALGSRIDAIAASLNDQVT